MELLAPGTELDTRELEVLDEVAGTPVVVGAGIGEAPHGYLYRAEVGETPVQLMVYDPRLLQSQDARLAVLEGIDQATTIEHSGIVPTFGLLEAPGSLASLRGDPAAPSLRETLHQRMAQGQSVDPSAAIDVALRLCDVLAALHEGDGHGPGMVHAYVTPDTVYVSDHGRVRLGAVGEGLALPYAPGFHRFHAAGLLPMVAPELRLDPPRAVPGTDVYGVATLLIELLTGRPVEMPGASLRAMGVPGPPMLVAALQRAISPDPSARPPNCRALGAELASASGRSTSAAPPPLPAAGAGAPPPPPPPAGGALPPPPPHDSARDQRIAAPPALPVMGGSAGPPPPPPVAGAAAFAMGGDDAPLPPPPPARLHSNTPTNLRQQRFPGATASGLIRLPSNTPSGLLPRPQSSPPTPPRPLRPADSLTARIEASDLATVSMSSGMRPSASGRYAQPRPEPQASVSDAEWAALDRATRQLEEAKKGDTHLFDPLPDEPSKPSKPSEPSEPARAAPRPPPAPPTREKSDLNLDLDEFDQAARRLTTVDGESGLLGLADGARSPGQTEEDSALIALRDRARKAKDGTHFGSFADDSGARPVTQDSGLIRDLEVDAPRSAASEHAAGRFVVRRRGVDEGPYTLSQLEDLIQAQQLASTDTVVRMGEDRERLAVDYEHLRPLFESRIELEVRPVASRSQARGPAAPAPGRPPQPRAGRGGGTVLLLLLALLVFGGAAAYLYLMSQGGL